MSWLRHSTSPPARWVLVARGCVTGFLLSAYAVLVGVFAVAAAVGDALLITLIRS